MSDSELAAPPVGGTTVQLAPWRLVLALALPVLGFVFYTWTTLAWSYSTGERAGYVQKFSRKGWICKTWEGELAMVSIPGTMPEKFYFTVRNDSVATFACFSECSKVCSTPCVPMPRSRQTPL